MEDTKGFLPKARAAGLIVQELPGELLVYDQERHKAHCLNNTALLVWRGCDGQTSLAGIARLVSAKLDTPIDEEVVRMAMEKLDSCHLLDESSRMAQPARGQSRREVLRRIGITAAVALPAITSIVAPRAAQAATCLPSGSGCSSSAQCCSGVCSASVCA
jgi:hypothetical protein